MNTRIMKQMVDCPNRQRVVEVKCAVSGSWFDRHYEVISCPAMYDAGPACNRGCETQLGNRPLINQAIFGMRA